MSAAKRELKKATEAAANQELQRKILRRQVRRDVTAYAVEVLELCRLAGLPDRAAGFIRAGISIESVRHTLQTIRVQSSEAFNVGGHITAEATVDETKARAGVFAKAIVDARKGD